MVGLFSTTSGFYGVDLDLVGSIRKNVEATGIWMEFPGTGMPYSGVETARIGRSIQRIPRPNSSSTHN
jgi:hypothetical protein